MTLAADVENDVRAILNREWDIRDGATVPDLDSIALAGGAVRLNATVLYADLEDSTQMVLREDRRVSAKVFKVFLATCSRIIRHFGGEIRSFDGDRVMGVFVGSDKNTAAATCALKINYAVQQVVYPHLASLMSR